MAGVSGRKNSSNVPTYTSISLQTSARGVCIPIGWGRWRQAANLIDYVDFASHNVKQSGGKGGVGGKGGSGSKTYSATILLALCEGVIHDVPDVLVSQAIRSTTSMGFTIHDGSQTTPDSYMASAHPDHAEAYNLTAYLINVNYDLGTSASLPSHAFEVSGNLSGSMAFPPNNLPDANPADIIYDLVTNTQYGLSLPVSVLDPVSFGFYKTYCQAFTLFLSPILESQEQVKSTLQRWAQITNSWIFWSANLLKFVPLGDQAGTDNGVTYTPLTTPIYMLSYDDFEPGSPGDPPITINRVDPSDGYNNVKLHYRDRNTFYNTALIDLKDQTLVDQFGLLPANEVQADEICDPFIAQLSASLVLKRASYIRNIYSFRLNTRYVLLEPGDIVEVSDANLGLAGLALRMVTIEEGDDGHLDCTAELFPAGVGSAPIYVPQPPGTTTFPMNTQAAPGPVNPPMIFEPDPTLTSGIPQVWLGLSGGLEWGGANVYISFDNVHFQNIGQQVVPARQGVLTAGLANHADPDTVDTLSVDLTESHLQLGATASTADADADRTIAMVDDEIVSYGTAMPTVGLYGYNLTYLRRGQLNTTPASHAINAPFTRIDTQAMFTYDLPQAYVGATLYFKFPSFNLFGNQTEDISSVPTYTYVPTGIGYQIAAPGSPILSAIRTHQADGTTVIGMLATWTASTGPLLGSYEVQYSADGGATWTFDTSVGPAALQYVLQPATASTSYQARVRAISQSGYAVSAWATSGVVSSGTLSVAAPSTPTGLTTTPGVGQIVASWSANAPGDAVLYYKLYRAPGLGALFGSAGLIATTSAFVFVDSGLAAGSQWTYFLIATNTAGDSAPTAGVNGTVLSLQNLWNPVVSLTERKPDAGEELFNIALSYPSKLAAGLPGSTGGTEVAFTNPGTFTLQRNGATVGTAVIPSGSTGRNIATFTMASDTNFATDDSFSLLAPSPQDPTGSGVFFSFLGSR